MATISNVAVGIVARTKGLEAGLKRATAKVGAFGKKVAKMPTGLNGALKRSAAGVSKFVNKLGPIGKFVGFAALAGSAMKFASSITASIKELDALSKTSRKLGATITGLQTLHKMADNAGVGITTLNTSMQRLVKNLSKASVGQGPVKAFAELGMSADLMRLKMLPAEQQMMALLEAIEKMPEGDRIRLLADIVDSEGVELIKMATGAAKEFADVRQQLLATGKMITEEEGLQMEKAAQAMADLSTAWSGLTQTGTLAFVAPVTAAVKYLEKTLERWLFLTKAGGRRERYQFWKDPSDADLTDSPARRSMDAETDRLQSGLVYGRGRGGSGFQQSGIGKETAKGIGGIERNTDETNAILRGALQGPANQINITTIQSL
jgi:hypothetical protein